VGKGFHLPLEKAEGGRLKSRHKAEGLRGEF